ncbi:uncharacterized protein CMU_016090 [Cryptosporidium muris RN66]|uniref:Uncharacterized protein n=1 Tax=Cryptosporidium muris (strain RN66) TaxID=441375 RepID=B6ACK6_CRYMR|nr:uncharacterized protein CMU_016090 [Cryptosporidium muris RN66]EEA05860.1 hypothetical protein CMU_016090 [Cryptosporidium muris RN66]|eukprot:XP_002140209.1 hypothetical protein [Cryptosporidium muris RN66]
MKFLIIYIALFILNFNILSVNGCKRYRETRINKVFQILGSSSPPKTIQDFSKCIDNSLYLTNVLNTARWKLIKNRKGTGWDETLIPPLMFCVKIIDTPMSYPSEQCSSNSIELIVHDGISTAESGISLSKFTNLSKGDEKCLFTSPCDLLNKIYWAESRFTNVINNLEFRILVHFQSQSQGRFNVKASIRGVARAMKHHRRFWDYDYVLTQNFEEIQAVSLYIPYKVKPNRFVSDLCLVKPSVTSKFDSNKSSLCSYEKCLWNTWIGQLTGEGVGLRCVIGKASANGEYFVGWYSPQVLGINTMGSAQISLIWGKPLVPDDICEVSNDLLNKLRAEDKNNNTSEEVNESYKSHEHYIFRDYNSKSNSNLNKPSNNVTNKTSSVTTVSTVQTSTALIRKSKPENSNIKSNNEVYIKKESLKLNDTNKTINITSLCTNNTCEPISASLSKDVCPCKNIEDKDGNNSNNNLQTNRSNLEESNEASCACLEEGEVDVDLVIVDNHQLDTVDDSKTEEKKTKESICSNIQGLNDLDTMTKKWICLKNSRSNLLQ